MNQSQTDPITRFGAALTGGGLDLQSTFATPLLGHSSIGSGLVAWKGRRTSSESRFESSWALRVRRPRTTRQFLRIHVSHGKAVGVQLVFTTTPWCNGNTSGFGPEIPGSNPGGVAFSTASSRRLAVGSIDYCICSLLPAAICLLCP